MIKWVLPLAASLAVAACSGPAIITSGGSDDGGGGGDTSEIPAALSNNLKSVTFDGTTMKVTIDTLDSTPLEVTYDRDTRLDVPGYTAYRMQEDSLDRLYVALGAISEDGAVQAVTVGDGGQFNRYFGGGSYDRAGAFDRPTIEDGPGAGQVSYAGTYAAVTNIDVIRNTSTDVAIDPTTSTGVDLPGQPTRIAGNIFLNANFSDNQVNGQIYDRTFVDRGTTDVAGAPLPSIALVPTTIATDGTFVGSAEVQGDPTLAAGTYGGIFGGVAANSVAGVTHFDGLYHYDGSHNPSRIDNGQEHGVFVLTQCGPNNTATPCDNVAP